MIDYLCAVCGQAAQFPDSLAGVTIRCPSCHSLDRLPSATPPSKPAPAPAPPPAAWSCPYCKSQAPPLIHTIPRSGCILVAGLVGGGLALATVPYLNATGDFVLFSALTVAGFVFGLATARRQRVCPTCRGWLR